MPQTINSKIPVHLGLILDGNRRWAAAEGIPALEGHRKGYENLKTIVLSAFDHGVSYVSAYIFSTENWGRSKEEVSYLMRLLLWIAKNEVAEFNKQNVRVRFLGEDTASLSELWRKAGDRNCCDSASSRTAERARGYS